MVQVPLSHIKFDLFFNFETDKIVMVLYNGLHFSMHKAAQYLATISLKRTLCMLVCISNNLSQIQSHILTLSVFPIEYPTACQVVINKLVISLWR